MRGPRALSAGGVGGRCASTAQKCCKRGRIYVNTHVYGLRFAPRRLYARLLTMAWWRATRRAVASATRCRWHRDGYATDGGLFTMISARRG